MKIRTVYEFDGAASVMHHATCDRVEAAQAHLRAMRLDGFSVGERVALRCELLSAEGDTLLTSDVTFELTWTVTS